MKLTGDKRRRKRDTNDLDDTPLGFELTEEGAKPRRSPARRVLRIAGRTGLGVLVLLIMAVVFAHSPWGKDLVRDRLEKALAAKVNGEARVGSLDYSFMLGDIEVKGIEIDDLEGRKAISLAELGISLDRRSLVSGTPRIEQLAVGGLELALHENADGTNNLTGLFVAGDEPKGKPAIDGIAIDEIVLDKLSATLHKADGSSVQVDKFGLRGAASIDLVRKVTEIDLENFDAELIQRSAAGKETVAPLHIGKVALARGEAEVDVVLEDFVAGPLEATSLVAHVATVEQALRGPQRFSLKGLVIDREQAVAMLGEVATALPSDLSADLEVEGPAGALEIDGTLRAGKTTLGLKGKVDLSNLEDPGYQVTLAGSGIDSTMITGDAPATRGDVEIRIKGHGVDRDGAEAELSIDVPRLAIGETSVERLRARARVNRGHVRLDSFELVGMGMDISASGELTPGGPLASSLRVKGSPAKARAALAKLGIQVPQLGALRSVDLAIEARGSADDGISVDIERADLALASGTVRARGTAALGASRELESANLKIELGSIDTAKLAAALGRPAKLGAIIGGTISVNKRGASESARFDIGAKLSDAPVEIRIAGDASKRQLDAHVRAIRSTDGAAIARIDARIPLRLGAARPVAMDAPLSATVQVDRRSLRELAALAPASAGIDTSKIPDGHATFELAVRGTARAPRGTIKAQVSAMAAPGLPRQRIDIEGSFAGNGSDVSLDSSVGVALGSLELLTANATIELPGALTGGKAEPELDVAITIPERKVSDFGSLAAIAGKLDGTIGGTAFVRGTPKAPQLSSSLAWKGYRTAGGAPGMAVIELGGSPAEIDAKIDFGYGGAIATATIEPKAASTRIRARARANDTQLATLLPAALVGKLDGIDAGRLNWKMDADIRIDKSSGRPVVEQALVRGLFTIDDALFVIPGTDRKIQDVDVHVAAVPGGIRLERLSAREKDDSGKRREIGGSGFLVLSESKPVSGQLSLKARDWLVFDGKKFGAADAPRAEVDFDIGVQADLARAVPRIHATVDKLELEAPERFDRHHQPLDIAPAGDVVFLDEGQKAGLQALVPEKEAHPEPAPATGKPAGGAPLDIVVEIPRPIRLHSAPLDVYAKGRVDVKIRPDGKTTAGKLIMTRGTMNVLGGVHQLSHGSFEISPRHPKGHLDLEFRRALPPAIARTMSKEAVEAGLVLRVQGSPDAPVLSFDGAADSLLDFMAMHNAGRGTAQTGLGVAASQSVQAPRGDQPMVLTFIGSNLPHLLFLDRFTAWSNSQGPEYGRVRNFEGESYSEDQKRRVRVISRPRQIGRSQAEVQVDRLLVNDDRAVIGVGVRAGSRIGGGLGVFVEWTSDD